MPEDQLRLRPKPDESPNLCIVGNPDGTFAIAHLPGYQLSGFNNEQNSYQPTIHDNNPRQTPRQNNTGRHAVLFPLQRAAFFSIWSLDTLYVIALLIIVGLAKANKVFVSTVTGPGAFFITEEPSNISVAYLVAALLTDMIGIIVVWQEIVQVVSLLLIFSFFLLIFSWSQMPKFFLILRCLAFVSGIEIRFALAAVLEMRPAVSAVGLPVVFLKWLYSCGKRWWVYRRQAITVNGAGDVDGVLDIEQSRRRSELTNNDNRLQVHVVEIS